MVDKEFLRRAIAAGAGREPADLVIKGAAILDVITGATVESDVAIVGDRIVGTLAEYDGREVIDGRRLVCVPGFIDTHLHVESSLVTPFEFERCVLPHGVTTAICDPHEIANVLGAEGIRYFLGCSERMVMDLRVQLSSCVPATVFETAGAALEAADLLPFRSHPKVIGLAEFMNFPGVIQCDPGVLDKLAAFGGGHVDGHAPLLGGKALNAYLAAGIRTEHEATSAAEAREKLAKGMTVLIREGSVSKDLHALAEVLDADTASVMALCTDDRNPLDIAEEGHLDHMIRELIRLGREPHLAYRAASWSAAMAFGLRDRGLVAPGWRADLVLVADDIASCRVVRVIAGGRPVSDALFEARVPVPPVGLDSMKAPVVEPADFRVPAAAGEVPVIGVVPGRIITERLAMRLPEEGGFQLPDPAQDAIRVAVVARHGRNRNIGKGFVHGFGLKRGAIASSVGHDSHNITVVGIEADDMAAAANRVSALGGGFVVASSGCIEAELALPLAGLMSLAPFESVHADLLTLRQAARGLGCTLPEPFLQVAFLPLPVIPHLKITDLGLFDVDAFRLLGA
ncbi:adenine deaminase [Propylenella binzhouense]|uniref:Adenine deaminase n=1 Tax=Propylenella binzhouense TaxID=2555902 RepID=A0A964T5D3_9HYPH|nr:adenine deaminase [Propylenella binzhouense]MYZ48197.1 adenine deaminase [Propylenella binzhouense]